MRSTQRKILLTTAFIALGTFSRPASAQFWERLTSPTTTVNITHSPRVVLKGVTKISVLEFTGNARCGPELTIRLTEVLGRSNKFELIDRASIDAVLREQGFQSSGAVSPTAAVKLGALLGPAAVITGRVVRCTTESSGLLNAGSYQDQKTKQTVTTYVRRITAHVTGSVALIDLTTGKQYAGDLIDVSDTLMNSAQNADPEAPSVDAVLSRVYATITSDVSRMVLPWREQVTLVVHDDKKCDLKTAAAQIKNGDLGGAADGLRAAIGRSCDDAKDTGVLSKAHYNLAIALVYTGHPEEGLDQLRTSSQLRRSDITNEAIAATQKIIALNAQRERKERDAVAAGEVSAASAAAAAAAAAATAAAVEAARLTNKDIIDMVKAKLGDAIIGAKIKSSPCKYDTSTSSLIALKQAGASDSIILAVSDAAANRCK